MYQVYLISKKTRQRHKVIETNLTEEQASRICEQWGWNYCDEHGVNWWIDYELMEN